jgi:MoaA/NifB/PqqE/SkfB family radical SAM enzyme
MLEFGCSGRAAPDLIYQEARFARIREIIPYFRDVAAKSPKRIHRVTLFTTFRCNLSCPYCHTIQNRPRPGSPGDPVEYTLPLFKRLMDRMETGTIDHIHFTGGEATLVRDLPEMMGEATDRGIISSLTTNGTARPDVYRELVRRGLREVRISCDTHVPERFDAEVGRRGAYERVLAAIRALTRLRDEGDLPVHIILNMCVSGENREDLVGQVKQSVALNPDDVKLIPLSQESKELGYFPSRQRIVEDLEDFLAELPPHRFPLLRRKLNTVFARHTWGLDDLASERLMAHCFVPLSERTVDAAAYYPCPVYVREGGAPLGRLTESFSEQQEKTLAFVRGESCREDPICRTNCINCLKVFNLTANALERKRVRGRSGEVEPITDMVTYPGTIFHSEIHAELARIAAERERFRRDVPFRPFLVIKPNGRVHRDTILSLMGAGGIGVSSRVPIPDWNAAAMRIYSLPLTEEKIFNGLLMQRSLPLIDGTSEGELLLLEGDLDFDALKRLKTSIRAHLPPANCVIFHREDLFVTAQRYVHTPDADSYWIEANVLGLV